MLFSMSSVVVFVSLKKTRYQKARLGHDKLINSLG